jgi:anti-anti-sigma regulatory factor
VHITVCGTLAERVAALALVSATRDVLEPGAQVTLDLSEIAAMDTAGVRAVRECIERAEHVEASLVLEDLSGAARRALGQAGR